MCLFVYTHACVQVFIYVYASLSMQCVYSSLMLECVCLHRSCLCLYVCPFFVPRTDEHLVSPGGGFGPVADDGYGVSYMVAREQETFFHVSRCVAARIVVCVCGYVLCTCGCVAARTVVYMCVCVVMQSVCECMDVSCACVCMDI